MPTQNTEYQPWTRNEVNANSKGGTEMMMEGIVARMDRELLSNFQLISSRVRELRPDKIRVYHIHDLPQDPETNHLQESSSRDRFHKIVFCGDWQFQQYRDYLKVPHDHNSVVIETAIDPIVVDFPKPPGPIKLVYTSTPQRGLDILVPVFEKLCEKHDNIELDVFSSFSIYGWAESDKPFEKLFERCRNHPKIRYHGTQPNEVVRDTLANSHIHAYPSTWAECNSRSVIEAMSAGMICVHPNYAGLPDTAGGMNFMYQWHHDKNQHAHAFYSTLDHAIQVVNSEDTQTYLRFVKMYADSRYNWTKIAGKWTLLLQALLDQYPTPESRKIGSGQVFHYKVGK